MLDIRLIGVPRVFLNGKQISISRKQTRAILFYLAMHPQGVGRTHLVKIFGGKGDTAKKRSTLRRYLNFVRSIDKEHDFVINYHESDSSYVQKI